jgi:glycine cleavage system H protein
VSLAIPDDLRYGEGDLWARTEGERVRVGVTDFAQDQLCNILYVDPPDVGDEVTAGRSMGEVESDKTVSDLVAPVTGTVVEVNEALEDRPELLNESPYGDGWIVVVEPNEPDALDHLMQPDEYAQARS